MENQGCNKSIPYEKFIWTMKKFSKSKSKKLSSKVFKIGGYPWQILLSPKGFGQVEDHLSLYLKLEDSVISPYRPIFFFAYFRLAVIDQLDSKKSVVQEAQKQFSPRNNGWGSQRFMPLTDFFDPSKGFLVNDKCIIEADVFVSKIGPLENIQPQNATRSNDQSEPVQKVTQKKKDQEREQCQDSNVKTSSAENFGKPCVDDWLGYPSISADEFKDISGLNMQREKPSAPFLDDEISSSLGFEQVDTYSRSSSIKDMPSTPINDLIDFWGLCQVKRAFVPLLEEVCSWHPSLIESKKKRSPEFNEWAFTALGRVLYFLKTTKRKDMKEVELCENLQVLWEELETFKFDLTWLEPHVRSAVDTEAYLERAEKVRELRDNVDSLEVEVKRLKAKMAAVVVDLEIARRDLAKAEEGFEERDLEIELGYI